MKIPVLLLGGLVLGSLVSFAPPARAQAGGCALLKPADLTALLGGTATATPTGGSCKWAVTGSAKKLLAMAMKATGPAAEMAFAGARQSAAREAAGKVTDEAGIGDKAFAVTTSFGVAMYMLKQGRLLQLQYWTGADGTARDVEALLPVAKKAIAAF